MDNERIYYRGFETSTNDTNEKVQSFWRNTVTDDVSRKENILQPNDIIYGLPEGNYKIVETVAPYGYKLNDIGVTFTVDTYGNIQDADRNIISSRIVTMVDTSIQAQIIDVEEDMTTPITDSEFKLTGQFAMDAGSAISERKTINYTTTDT